MQTLPTFFMGANCPFEEHTGCTRGQSTHTKIPLEKFSPSGGVSSGILHSRGILKNIILCRHKTFNPPEGLIPCMPCRGKTYKIPLAFFNFHSSGIQSCRKLWRENVIHPIRGLVFFWLQRGFGIIFTEECFRKYIPRQTRQTVFHNTSKGFFVKLPPQKVDARNPSIIYFVYSSSNLRNIPAYKHVSQIECTRISILCISHTCRKSIY